MECPFCGFKSQAEQHEDYAMQLHIESEHSETHAAFKPDEHLSNPENTVEESDGAGGAYVECPIADCTEVVLESELDYHLELHSQEAQDDSTTPPTATENSSPAPQAEEAVDVDGADGDDMRRARSAKRRRSSPTRDTSQDSDEIAAQTRRKKAVSVWRNILPMPKWSKSNKLEQTDASTAASATSASSTESKMPKMLGKAELGRYAHERQMPDWLVKMLKRDGQVVGEDVIPVLKQMLQQTSTTEYAYLCHPSVQHVSKLRLEGGFCGYRNIQMMSSYIIGAGFMGTHNNFNGKLPSIFDIQEFIEAAWDQGINKQGRVETGGIRGTRKYIGTPEALAMFVYLHVPCEAQGFKNKKEAGKAEASLLVNVERYFQQGKYDPNDKVRSTMLPPIYFQHAGHSMTIVGIEKLKDGKANLLVFDPMFRDATLITQRAGRKFKYKYPDMALNAYRRGHKYLKRFREFEVLR
ncbi:peptidase family C78-domain-containing protein [Coniella lustricola]|uniref:Peptidase family C78-domain-containing protein n=1 Tax=Coniella lustricola TaxID=2025994 RepID=A0A2T3AL52_9PEZI|nr:peptidase family C78-domain-containing protein [Coniella lustricola]